MFINFKRYRQPRYRVRIRHSASKKTEELIWANDLNSASVNSERVRVEIDLTVENLLKLVGEKSAFVTVTGGSTVIIFASSRDEAHQIVQNEIRR